MSRPLGADVNQDLDLLDAKIKQAKFEYDQYFLGHRPREPNVTRAELQKIVAYWSNLPIRNTAVRFRFNTLCARYFSFRRQWDENLRKIEEGSFEPHLWKAKRRSSEGSSLTRLAEREEAAALNSDDVICSAYLEARRSCGEDVTSLDTARVAALLARQREQLREKYNCKDVRFKVVVENGKARLKATPVQ